MARRIALWMSAAVAGILAVGVFSAAAAADSSRRPTVVGRTLPTAFSATTAGGKTVQIDVVIRVELLRSRVEAPKVLASLRSGEIYCEVSLQTATADAADLPVVLPMRVATLRTPSGTVSPSRGSSESDWYFPIASSSAWVILKVTSATYTTPVPLRGLGGQKTMTSVHPFVVAFVIPPQARAPARHASSAAEPLAFAAGAIVVLVGGGILAVARRRAFYRADREGRVLLVAPPATAADTEEPQPEGLAPPARERILVKILGWLEITRTKRTSERVVAVSGPVAEIVVFLVLNPGRTFTSIQLREAIWGLGRSPVTSATFRTYMVRLRKAFGTGVVVTERYRYELTAAVDSDLNMFRAAQRQEDRLAGSEEALELVRGPVLNGCFDGKKNSPFAWAVDTANAVEDEVTSVAYNLTRACLEEGEPERGARALARGLLCSTTNLWLRLLELEVGLALGGAGELSRRLEAGRAALAGFPEDVARLEEAARQLGGEALRS